MEHTAAVRSRELEVHLCMERSHKHTVKLTNIKKKKKTTRGKKQKIYSPISFM